EGRRPGTAVQPADGLRPGPRWMGWHSGTAGHAPGGADTVGRGEIPNRGAESDAEEPSETRRLAGALSPGTTSVLRSSWAHSTASSIAKPSRTGGRADAPSHHRRRDCRRDAPAHRT